ncbi:hypothetical protein Goshw_008141 [Gossypium schwendimanii]|uniref:Uncharacterized protein n=1 Tax=Gossypium schwendimanii TaxID=34291 RepID=A0A7J9MRT3_GOSSC|nr:hypothetical protein [Gossypium schwendimanii]
MNSGLEESMIIFPSQYLETNEDCQNEQLHHLQNQVRNKDHIMGEVVVQIREVVDHL